LCSTPRCSGVRARDPEAAPAGPRAALRLIRSRQFGPYFVGNAASATGAWFQNLAAQLLVFLLIVTAVGFASDPINTLAPAFAREFGYHDTVAGLIIGAFGFGAVSAAFLLAGRVAGTRRRMVTTLTLLGLGVIAFSLSPWLALGFVFLVVAGFGYLALPALAMAAVVALRGRKIRKLHLLHHLDDHLTPSIA
jgi:MFS family permease